MHASWTLLLVAVGSACSSIEAPPAQRVAEVLEGSAVTPSPDAAAKLGEAETTLAAGDVETAIRLTRRVVAEEPRVSLAHVILGKAFTALAGTLDDAAARIDAQEAAETHLLTATKLTPREADAHAALGALYETGGHLEAALAAYRRAVDLEAFHPAALVAAARLATDLGEERDAIRHLEALRNGVPDFPTEALLWEARCYLALAASEPDQAGDWLPRAARAFRDLGERRPDDPRAPGGEAHARVLLASRADGPIEEEERKRIRELCRRAARLAPDDPTPRFNMACFLESRLVGDTRGAMEEYRATLARDPRHLPSLLNLARLLWQAGEKDPARELYRRALPLVTDERERKRVTRLLES